MTNYISIQEAMNQREGEVSIRGWIYRERGNSKIRFIVIRDVTNIIQCIVKRENLGDNLFDRISKLQIEASLEILGDIKPDERAPTGYEINVNKINIVGDSDTYPIQKDQSPEFLLDNRHLWIRSRKMTAILKIRSTIFGAIHEYFRTNQFFEFHSPIFTSNQCEGGSTLFKVDYFGQEMHLAQTWQLYAEAGIFSLEKIYCIAPSFRAEKSKTSRHLTEYWHAEAEGAWFNFDNVLEHGQNLIKHIVKKVLEINKPDLEILERDTSKLIPSVEKPFIRMTYDEALIILKEKCDLELEWGNDLRTIEEEKLTKLYDVPLMVTHYPKQVKAFYMEEDKENPKVVLGVDFLAPEGYGEIIGGSQRESDAEKLNARLREQGENPEDYGWYLDLRKHGSVPHGGFGLGVERVITWICGLDNIKDAIPFPRTMLRYTP
jgi:asparaginyl-tRNA synthetase